jgi:hypothetical protein
MTWEPIEKAPKDGTEILVGEAGTLNIELVRWNSTTDEWLDRTADPFRNPTHWMPKPEPPN